MAFQRYQNLSMQSNVAAFEIGPDSITVEFRSGKHRFYVYNSVRPGVAAVEELKRRALAGRGLNSYISSTIKTAFANKY